MGEEFDTYIAEKRNRIRDMDLPEIVEFMKEIEGSDIWFYYGGALTQRLYQTTLFNNHVSDETRKVASELLRLVKEVMEGCSPLNPEKFRIYAEANAYMEEQALLIGVGSLAWLLKEYNITGDDGTIAFLSRPDIEPLLPKFFDAVGPELAAEFRARLNIRST